LPIAAPNAEDQLDPWWLETRSSLDRRNKNRFDAWVMLICWSIWNQRNARVFGNLNKQCNEDVLAARVLEDMELWSLAGVGVSNLGREL
jgi:hypothetical protein